MSADQTVLSTNLFFTELHKRLVSVEKSHVGLQPRLCSGPGTV
jgi:hypothetical protein